jgi:deazaflavin-dependent oxidoreductase (nitroreductase family)
MRDRTAKHLSTFHTVIYRATGGRLGRRLIGNDMVLLTTRGKRTGRPHTVPLLYLRDQDDLVVIASWGGRPYHPDWYTNLEAHPRATVQVSDRTWNVSATTMNGAEREEWWPRIVDAYNGYAAYQSQTDRSIPVVRLQPTE